MVGPYGGVEEARRLASILTQADWRCDTDMVSRQEVATTQQVIRAYNEALVNARGGGGDRALAGRGIQPADLFLAQ